MSRLAKVSAIELAELFRLDALTPSDATDWYLNEIANFSDTAIFLCVTAERARREAAASTGRYRRGDPIGPLDGVPVAWKDLFDVEGTPTTAGSEIYRSAPASPDDAAVVHNLASSGMVTIGKVNLTEFAYSGLGLNPHFGTPRNPFDRTVHRIPGGSSSGSAVSVAAGLIPCAIGTDTGGSIRIPAALNGLVGFKTREGAIDKRGVFALSPTLDTVGPLARSVKDCIALDSALRGLAPAEILSASFREMSFLVPLNVVFDEAEPAVIDNFHGLMRALRSRGARVIERKLAFLDDFQSVSARHGTITAAEAYYRFRPLLESVADRSRIDSRVVDRIERGTSMSAFDLLKIFDVRLKMQAQMNEELAGAILTTPTVPQVAPPVAPLEADTQLFHATNVRMLRNTTIGNFLNLPGLAISSGADGNGLPTSVLFSCQPGDEPKLFASGLAIEKMFIQLSG